ncbi:hypothetical protein [Pseudorhodoplanes sp.]|uniref:hypothetical protein n=1 Tax=Pseudorhodoplanes sp. TaxID=1934341 RepID=UPI002BB2AB1C|nr:hypothetical protein [Pseudorhodoplanes sp.]HWV52994.1 hypothetical protein [Pseudorhodoplanes sp.]
MADADENFERARRAFRNAAAATSIAEMRAEAERGLAWLERADLLSAVVEIHPRRSVAAPNDQ